MARVMLPDRVLFIDAEAMILDKPAGLAVDPPRDGSLSVANHIDALRFGFERFPLIVHRLDRDTSGCLLMARNPKAQKRFSATFEAGSVEKTYLAVLDGVPEAQVGEVDMPLSKVSTRADGWRMVGDVQGKSAKTAWRVLKSHGMQALVEMRPATGRTHQLRVHAAAGIGHAIVGDPIYGTGHGPMLLHAASLSVPRTAKEPVAATAPLPPHFPDWTRG